MIKGVNKTSPAQLKCIVNVCSLLENPHHKRQYRTCIHSQWNIHSKQLVFHINTNLLESFFVYTVRFIDYVLGCLTVTLSSTEFYSFRLDRFHSIKLYSTFIDPFGNVLFSFCSSLINKPASLNAGSAPRYSNCQKTTTTTCTLCTTHTSCILYHISCLC